MLQLEDLKCLCLTDGGKYLMQNGVMFRLCAKFLQHFISSQRLDILKWDKAPNRLSWPARPGIVLWIHRSALDCLCSQIYFMY
jgi:hypothetical protein